MPGEVMDSPVTELFKAPPDVEPTPEPLALMVVIALVDTAAALKVMQLEAQFVVCAKAYVPGISSTGETTAISTTAVVFGKLAKEEVVAPQCACRVRFPVDATLYIPTS